MQSDDQKDSLRNIQHEVKTLRPFIRSNYSDSQKKILPHNSTHNKFLFIFVCSFMVANIVIHYLAICMKQPNFNVFSFNLEYSQELILSVLTLIPLLQLIFLKILGHQIRIQYPLYQSYTILVSIPLIFTIFKIPMATIAFAIIFLVVKIRNKLIFAKNLKKLLPLIQFFLILLKLDGIINLPWGILLFQALFILIFSYVSFASFMEALFRINQINLRQQTQISQKLSHTNLILASLIINSLCFLTCNWIYADFNILFFTQLFFYINIVALGFTLVFWPQISYSFSQYQFIPYYRLSQNQFSLKFHKAVSLYTQWFIQLCSQCHQREANILFYQCKHMAICEKCLAYFTLCPICAKKSNVGKISFSKHIQNDTFKFNFYHENQFKVFPL